MASDETPWWRHALRDGVQATCLWRAVRDEHGDITDLEIVECDEGLSAWMGQEVSALAGSRYSALVPSGMRERLPAYIAVIEEREPRDLVFMPVPRPGRPTVAEVRLVPCGNDLIWSVLSDVSDRERRYRGLVLERDAAVAGLQQLIHAVNASPDALAVYEARRDAGGRVVGLDVAFVNEAAAGPTGRLAELWRDVDIRDFFPEAVETGIFASMLRVIETQVPATLRSEIDSIRGWHGTFDANLTPFGADFVLATWHESGAQGSSQGLVPERDRLTGLLSIDGLKRAMQDLLPLFDGHALVCFDVDGFGFVNDRIGRHRADRVLVAIAEAIDALEPAPVLRSRTGHDEFAFVVPASDPEAIVQLHTRLSRTLADIGVGAGIPGMHASAGARILRVTDAAPDIMHDCDAALRAAKAAGDGRLTIFSDDLAVERARIATVAEDIADALRGDGFVVAYQRIMRVESGQLWGVEALARWRHPTAGLLMPGEFIPVAEASGRIIDLGARIVELVVADLAAHPSMPHATVNVSAVQLLESDVPSVIARALEQQSVDASRLLVEITESALLVDSERVRRELHALRAIGVRIAIDDFGTGYSSIAYLDRIPFDIAKLDGYFLDGELDWRRRSLISSTASMVRSLGAMSLAEHVETEDQAHAVREAGIDLVQGYHFGRPTFLMA